ncbi:T9SS type A sorting domain-containing protein [uncultured Winogradskyella sp.]|uniref:T9SS type A sorting domain-containing protein n=1 Tax=uncultured Winogradskyella sp. TaxID=395353 RepID=UPI0026305A7D|nr:T9SS type A sorting domain-containing protein [uncultured Winogradskyella sp.]
MNLKLLFRCYLLCTLALLGANNLVSQNLLDTSSWTIGSGSISGYSQYGLTEENTRVYKHNHVGDEVMVWQASPNSGGQTSGGFTSPAVNIDHNKMYRLSIWIKKENSNDGVTQFKPNTYSGGAHHTTYLNGDVVSWHPFWYGDLPELNKWYLLVGYVHASSDNSTIDLGKIYDGVTGEAVVSMRDHKFKNSATILQNRPTLWNSLTTSDRQYMYAPRIEIVDGSEYSLDQLLSINPNSKLLFAFDNAGNQKQRFYCSVPGCSVPNPPAGRAAPQKEEVAVAEEDITKGDEDLDLNAQLTLYPNPTNGLVSVTLNSNSDVKISNTINVYNNVGILVKKVPGNTKNKQDIDFTNLASGMYLVHIHLSNGTSITKQIIKN